MIKSIINRALNGEFVLIAEIGVNYYDIAEKFKITPLEAAKLMVKEAKNVGIHAVKFQTYKADTLTVKSAPSYWDTREEATKSQHELFKKFDSFSFYEYCELADYCKNLDIEFLSTAFDTKSADYLYDLMNVYKISSSDLNNIPFVEYQAKKGKPIILSTGASNEEEIDETIKAIRRYNDKTIAILHCVLEYPTPDKHANLNRIFSLKSKYPNHIIGYSDHTKPDKNVDIIKTAYNLGARIIEKHFTLDKSLIGNDHYHSMDPNDAMKILDGIRFIDEIRGEYSLDFLDSEIESRKFARRSIVSNTDIIAGTVITRTMLTYKRPGTGIPPSELESLIGRIAKVDIKEDTIIEYTMLQA